MDQLLPNQTKPFPTRCARLCGFDDTNQIYYNGPTLSRVKFFQGLHISNIFLNVFAPVNTQLTQLHTSLTKKATSIGVSRYLSTKYYGPLKSHQI